MKDAKISAIDLKKIESKMWGTEEIRDFDEPLQIHQIYYYEAFRFLFDSALQHYDVNGKDVINAGGGDGEEAEALLKAGANSVVIVDIALGQLKNAIVRRKTHGLMHLDVILGDAESIPVADKSFNLGFIFLALHHFTNHEKAISEICRVSKEIVFVDIMNAPITRALNLFGFYKEEQIYAKEEHVINVTPNRLNVTEVEKYLNDQKIKMKVRYIFCPPYYGNNYIIRRIVKAISKIVNSIMNKNKNIAYIFGNIGIICKDKVAASNT